jgi:predicted TPR repeat methyltransferase
MQILKRVVFKTHPVHYFIYKKELKRLFQVIKINKFSIALELGFGDGVASKIIRQKADHLIGVELDKKREIEAKNIFDAIHIGEIDSLNKKYNGKIDFIFAFHVIEHMSFVQIKTFVEKTQELLCDDGVILLSFPNGVSPFGRIDQYSDQTHKTVITPELLKREFDGFEIIKIYNAARPFFHPLVAPFFALIYSFRTVIEKLISFTYFLQNMPLDKHMTIILKKRQQ